MSKSKCNDPQKLEELLNADMQIVGKLEIEILDFILYKLKTIMRDLS